MIFPRRLVTTMIACRSLFRVDRAWIYTNTSKPVQYLQECCFHYGLNHKLKIGAGKDRQSGMDWKKQKPVTPVWRPVCTQSSSSQDVCKVSHGIQVRNISSSASNAQLNHKDGEATNGPADEKHSVSVEVGASLMRFIKGKWGSTQKNIEEEIGVKIIFPPSKKEDSIIIEGISAESVTRASERVQVIIDKAVKSPNLDYSHFVSLPLAIHPELVDKLLNFQKSILGTSNANDYAPRASKPSDLKASKSSALSDLGIEESIFIKPHTFHLTVLMLKLWNKDRVDAAAAVLQNVSSRVLEALDSRPVSVGLKGLDCMRGSLAKAHVVYAPVEEIGGEGRLIRACEVIIDAFVEAGLVLEKNAQQKLKLHATVMNARHRKWEKWPRNLDSFDARGIFKQFGSEEWGEYHIREAHLSQRFIYDENGYYHCCASIPFPESVQLD